MLMFIFCFHQRRLLLTAFWRAKHARWDVCLLLLCINVFSIIPSTSSAPFIRSIFPPALLQCVLLWFLVPFLNFLLCLLRPSLHCFCGSVLRVLRRRSPDSVHPVSPAGSPRGWLPAPPETRHFQGLQHSVLPRCPLCPCTKLWPGLNTQR